MVSPVPGDHTSGLCLLSCVLEAGAALGSQVGSSGLLQPVKERL